MSRGWEDPEFARLKFKVDGSQGSRPLTFTGRGFVGWRMPIAECRRAAAYSNPGPPCEAHQRQRTPKLVKLLLGVERIALARRISVNEHPSPPVFGPAARPATISTPCPERVREIRDWPLQTVENLGHAGRFNGQRIRRCGDSIHSGVERRHLAWIVIRRAVGSLHRPPALNTSFSLDHNFGRLKLDGGAIHDLTVQLVWPKP